MFYCKMVVNNNFKFQNRSISLVGEQDRWLVKEIVKSSAEPVKCRVIPPGK